MKTRSVFSWYGSDSEVAAVLGAKFDHCRHVTIPFCGGLGILPHLKAKAIVANDRHELAINFYRVASGVYGNEARERLFELCQQTLSHPGELRKAKRSCDSADEVTSAWAFWACCWLGRKGKAGTKDHLALTDNSKASIRRTADGGNNATRIQAAAGDLFEWATRHFSRCEWECEDFRRNLMKVADRMDCGIYVDPPWDGPGGLYLHSFTQDDHVTLRGILEQFQETTVVVRYGDTEFIRDLYRRWTIEEAATRDQANQAKPEIWITNNAMALRKESR